MGWCGSPWAEFGRRWNELDPSRAANEQGAHVASAKLPVLGSGVLWAGVQAPALGPWGVAGPDGHRGWVPAPGRRVLGGTLDHPWRWCWESWPWVCRARTRARADVPGPRAAGAAGHGQVRVLLGAPCPREGGSGARGSLQSARDGAQCPVQGVPRCRWAQQGHGASCGQVAHNRAVAGARCFCGTWGRDCALCLLPGECPFLGTRAGPGDCPSAGTRGSLPGAQGQALVPDGRCQAVTSARCGGSSG